MGISSALSTALSGLSTSQTQISVVGNNIANVNTVGFKSSRLDFKTQFLQNFSLGTAPSAELGGTNPVQIGLGTQAGAVTRDFGDGSLQVTGVPTNLAIQGEGFFVLQDAGKQVYTRDGSFQLNGLNQLVSGTGQLVMGYGVDSNFNLVPGTLNPLTVPLNSLTVAEATKNMDVNVKLNSTGLLPTAASDQTLAQPFYLSNGSGGVDPTNPPTGSTLLSAVTDGSGTAYFQNGDTITISGTKGTPQNGNTTFGSGTHAFASKSFTVTSSSTLADLQSFLTGAIGINTTAGVNAPTSSTPGVTIPTGSGTMSNTVSLDITGNPGYDNNINLDPNSLKITSGGVTSTPFTWNSPNSLADGESVRSTAVIYDSLGSPVTVNVTAVLQSKSSSGTTWQYYIDSPDGSATGAATQTAVGTGVLTFDTNGNLVSTTPASPTFTIDRSNTGANPNLAVTLNFSGQTFAGQTGTITATNVDGQKPGTLVSYQIGNDGKITGSFNNNVSRVLGQVVLATFRNNEGLIDQGGNSYIEGPNSGPAIIQGAGTGAAGVIKASSLELSNVDLSSEFVRLISASTAFSANSRVITSSNQLLQELLSAAR